METYEEILEKLKKDFHKRIQKKTTSLIEKMDKAMATYEDANYYSIVTGNSLSETILDDITDVFLENGYLPYGTSKDLILPLIQENFAIVTSYCASVQKSLNEKAGIGIGYVAPEFDADRAYGIVYGATTDEYEKIKYKYFGESLINQSQDIVTKSVRTNANFQYESGMSPKIIRTVVGGCCDWCANLAGTYDYEKVKESDSDIWRRHRYCRCMVTYVPIKGRAQDVWSKKLLSKEERINRIESISNLQEKIPEGIRDVTKEYLKNANPGEGKIEFEEGYQVVGHDDEIKCSEWIQKNLGGDVLLLKEINEDKVKQADYLWNGLKWDLKSPTGKSKNTISNQFSKIKEQLGDKPGGMILDISKTPLSEEYIFEEIARRYKFDKYDFDVLVKKGNTLLKVFRKQ